MDYSKQYIEVLDQKVHYAVLARDAAAESFVHVTMLNEEDFEAFINIENMEAVLYGFFLNVFEVPIWLPGTPVPDQPLTLKFNKRKVNS